MTIGEYIEPSYKSHAAFIDNSTYGKILDSIVVACVDLLVLHDNRVLLGKRSRHPQKDWWMMGGRMITGETFTDSAQRIANHELGLFEIDSERFKLETAFSAAWDKRAFSPEQNGTHTLSVVLSLKINEEEKAMLTTNDEYEDSAWRDIADIAHDENFHPALRQCLRSLSTDQ